MLESRDRRKTLFEMFAISKLFLKVLEWGVCNETVYLYLRRPTLGEVRFSIDLLLRHHGAGLA